MDMTDLVSAETVVPDLRVSSKKQALQELAHLAAAATGVAERTIFEALLERERLGTTGIGKGVAIPHAKLPRLETVRGLFARLPTPIDFEAVDAQPVDLIFLLLAPETAGADHLRALARVSRQLRDAAVCEQLRAASDRGSLFVILTTEAHSHAA